jgi:hypothetical protein
MMGHPSNGRMCDWPDRDRLARLKAHGFGTCKKCAVCTVVLVLVQTSSTRTWDRAGMKSGSGLALVG